MSKFSYTPSLFDFLNDSVNDPADDSDKKVICTFQLSKIQHDYLVKVAAYQKVSVSFLIRSALINLIFKKGVLNE